MMEKYLSLTEVSQLLKISRTHVWRKIKSGEIRAEKAGNAYIIPIGQFEKHQQSEPVSRKEISDAVRRVVKEYGTTLKKLGAE